MMKNELSQHIENDWFYNKILSHREVFQIIIEFSFLAGKEYVKHSI